MFYNVYAVRDIKSNFYYPPFFLRNTVEAIRAFQRVLDDPNRAGARSEYELVLCAQFDDETCIFSVTDIQRVALGSDFSEGKE